VLLKSPPGGVDETVVRQKLVELGMLSDIEALSGQFDQ
jgi:hypothetical protein